MCVAQSALLVIRTADMQQRKDPREPSPEQRRAIKVLRVILGDWKKYFQPTPPSAQRLMCTDFCAGYNRKITKASFWHGKGWQWNQSNASLTVQLSPTMKAVVRKFNPRRERSAPPSSTPTPSYKIWTFEVSNSGDWRYYNGFSMMWCLWCERGCDKKEPAVVQPDPCLFEPVTAEDLYAILGIPIEV